MRKREHIEADIAIITEGGIEISKNEELIIELLLDIREILIDRVIYEQKS